MSVLHNLIWDVYGLYRYVVSKFRLEAYGNSTDLWSSTWGGSFNMHLGGLDGLAWEGTPKVIDIWSVLIKREWESMARDYMGMEEIEDMKVKERNIW